MDGYTEAKHSQVSAARGARVLLNEYNVISAYHVLPLRSAIDDYVREGRPIGGFLRALLSNDLREAVARADETNTWLLPVYASYLYNEVPGAAWGSAERVDAWLASFRQEEVEPASTHSFGERVDESASPSAET